MSHYSNTRNSAVSANTVVSRASQISEGRKSLRATSILDKPEFKGDKRFPSYAIDAEVEGILDAVDRTDNGLSALELGKKYVNSLGEVEFVIADLSGTVFEDLHKPVKLFPGALEAFNLAKQAELSVILVTNSWNASKTSLLELLRSTGFEVEMEDIYTSTEACKHYLKEHNLERPFYLTDEDVLQDFAEEYNNRSDEDCVIVGLPSTLFDYRLMAKGMSLLLKGVPLIALNMMQKEVSPDVRNVNLGAGPFVTLLSFSTDADPVTMCKPYPQFYEALCAKIGCPDYSKIVVIGDDLWEDVAGAKALGMKTILTRTGRYQANDEKTLCSGFAPDATAENFPMAIRLLLAARAVSQMSEEDCDLEEKSTKACGADLLLPKHEVLTRKMEAYLAADYKSGRTRNCTPVVRLPSYIW